MTEELEVTPQDNYPVPIIGSIIDLEQPEQVAQAIDDVKRAFAVLGEAKRMLEGLLVEESRKQGSKTLHLPGYDVEVKDDKTLVWNLEVLEELRAAGLPEERFEELVRPKVEYSVSALKAKQIERSGNEQYASIIGRARSYEERTPRVSIRRPSVTR